MRASGGDLSPTAPWRRRGSCLACGAQGVEGQREEDAPASDAEAKAATMDKLVEVFRSKGESKWLRLMAQSQQWDAVKSGVFERLAALAEEAVFERDRLEAEGLLARLRKTDEEHGAKKELFAKLVGATDAAREVRRRPRRRKERRTSAAMARRPEATRPEE